MKARIIVGTVIAAAIAVAGTVTLAQQPRVVRETRTDRGEGVLFSCSNGAGGTFDVVNRWEAIGTSTTRFNAAGQIVEILFIYKYTVDELENSVTGNTLDAGPGEIQQMRLIFKDGEPAELHESGAIMKLNVPGYGLVYAETGHVRIDLNGGGVYFDSGHNALWEGFSAEARQATCDALK